jgi:hypothetical protein
MAAWTLVFGPAWDTLLPTGCFGRTASTKAAGLKITTMLLPPLTTSLCPPTKHDIDVYSLKP